MLESRATCQSAPARQMPAPAILQQVYICAVARIFCHREAGIQHGLLTTVRFQQADPQVPLMSLRLSTALGMKQGMVEVCFRQDQT